MSRIYLSTAETKRKSRQEYIATRQIVKRSQQSYSASKRAKKWGVENTLTSKEWLNVLIESQGRCFYCKKDVGAQNLGMDHVIPMSRGGANSLGNIVASCFPCNAKKGKFLSLEEETK